MSTDILVACVGNIFLGDDGFGVEVAQRLASARLPDRVRVEDFGIRSVHLAYELANGYDTAILVDAAPRGDAPGTIYVIEPELPVPSGALRVRTGESPLIDAHGMEPASVLGLLGEIGGTVGRVVVVGCEPADVSEGIGLSEPVLAAVDEAVGVVMSLVERALASAPSEQEAGRPQG